MRTIDAWIRIGGWRKATASLLLATLVGAADGALAQSFSDSPHAVPVALPACDASDPEVRIIDSVADWASVNDPSARIFCVRPGRYAPAGRILLETSGTAKRPRILRYEDPAAAGAPHPVRLAPAQRAIVQELELRGADRWLIDGLTVQGAPATGVILDDASHNVLNRLLVQDTSEALVKVRGVSHRNVIQNSVVRRTRVAPDDDRACLVFNNPGVGLVQAGNRVVQNELYDCTDGIQLHLPSGATAGGHFPGLVIDGNDIYLSPARYTNCRGAFDRNGACGCAENGIDVKIGGLGSAPDEVVSITDNRIWGWRETDHGPDGDNRGRCGGSGSWGDLVMIHALGSHLSIQGNRIFDGPRGIGIGSEAHHVVLKDNVLHGLDRGWSLKGYSIAVGGSDNEVRRNVIADSQTWLSLPSKGSERTVARCNVVVASAHAAGEPGAGSRLDYNTYYGATQGVAAGPHDLVFAEETQAPGAPLCFWRKRWTSPERVCLPYGTYAVESAYADVCSAPSATPAPAAPQAPRVLAP